jgi:uncharacterized membrane protein
MRQVFPPRIPAPEVASGSASGEARPPTVPAGPALHPIREDRLARIVLGVITLVMTVLLCYWSVRDHAGFGQPGFDMGIFDQGTWLLSRFKSPFVTVMGLDLFGDHTSFILFFLVPFYWMFDSANVLLVAQGAAIGIAAVPVFLIAREKLRSERLALLFGVVYLFQPAVGWMNWENFHPDPLEVPIFLFGFFFLMTKRWRAFLICVALLLAVKEDVPLLTLPLGLYVAVFHHRRIGLGVAAVSLVWFVAALWFVFPAINGTGTLDAFRIPYGGFGGLFKAILTRPWDVATLAFSEDRPWYLWQLFIPVAFLSLVAPEILFIALGALLSNLLSTFWYQHSIEYHYTSLVVPVIVVAAIYGVARLPSLQFKRIASAGVLVCTLVTGYMWGPWPLAREPGPLADPSRPEVALTVEALDHVPPDASVSAYYGYVTHLSHREEIYEFPNPWHAVNWADASMEGQRLPIADSVEYVVLPSHIGEEQYIEILEVIKPEFTTVYENSVVQVLKREGI